MNRKKQSLLCIVLFSIGFCATVSSIGVNAVSEQKLNSSSDQPSIEILALSRGSGVPETTYMALQKIAKLAKTTLESGSAVSVKQETIGLEGETRLCVVFRDEQTFAKISKQIRKLATKVDLLQVNDNGCSGS